MAGNVPRKPRLVGGAKGRNKKRSFISGKPRPVDEGFTLGDHESKGGK